MVQWTLILLAFGTIALLAAAPKVQECDGVRPNTFYCLPPGHAHR